MSRKNIFHACLFALCVFLIPCLLSCGSIPGTTPRARTQAADPAGQKNLSALGTLQISFVDTVTDSLNQSQMQILHDPEKNEYVLEIPYNENTSYRQFWNAEALNLLSDAVSRFALDESQNRLGVRDTRSFTSYGAIESMVEWYDSKTGTLNSAEPGIDIGYLVTGGKIYFLLTQRDSAVIGDETGGLRSARFTYCMGIDQVRSMMSTLNCKFIEKPLLVFLGESVTAGYNLTVQGEEDHSKAYPAVLQDILKINVLNSGDGWASTEITLDRVEEDVARYDPDIVVIELGFSDFMNKVDPADTNRNIQEIINILKNRGEPKIYLIRFYDERTIRSTMEYWEMTEREQANLLASYDGMFRNLSRNNGIELITGIWEGLEYDDTIGDDSLHPTIEGQRIMAGNIFRYLRPYLESHNFLK